MTREAAEPTVGRPRAIDVARLAGVSQSAVSRTFRPGASIAPATRSRVLTAATSLGYRPNVMARAVTTKRSGVIAVVMHDGMLLYYPEVLAALTRAVAQVGMRVMLFTVQREGEIDDAVDQIIGYQVDGAVVLNAVSGAALTALTRAGVAVVLYNRASAAHAIDAVGCEHAAAGRAMAMRLIGLGHRRFGLIAGPASSEIARERARGFAAVLAAEGLGDGLVAEAGGDFTYASGLVAARTALTVPHRPTALVAINDAMALGAIDCARSLGLGIPADLSIAGFDGNATMSWLAYDLETMVQPVDRIASAAVDMIAHRLRDPESAREQRVFQYSRRAGATVGPPRVGATQTATSPVCRSNSPR